MTLNRQSRRRAFAGALLTVLTTHAFPLPFLRKRLGDSYAPPQWVEKARERDEESARRDERGCSQVLTLTEGQVGGHQHDKKDADAEDSDHE